MRAKTLFLPGFSCRLMGSRVRREAGYLMQEPLDGLATVISRFIPERWFADEGKRHRVYTPYITFCAFLGQVLQRGASCREAVRRGSKIRDRLKMIEHFRRFQDDRLMTSGGSAAASEYITRADALGGAIPSLSFAAGRNPIPRFGQTRNIDLMTQQDGWGRAGGRWFHSDAKNMAYRYNYKLWDTWVDVGGLK